MKKKLALLLALAMIISTLPMNVFGQTIYHPGGGGTFVQSIGNSSSDYRKLNAWGGFDTHNTSLKHVHDWKVAIDLNRYSSSVRNIEDYNAVFNGSFFQGSWQGRKGATNSALALTVDLSGGEFAGKNTPGVLELAAPEPYASSATYAPAGFFEPWFFGWANISWGSAAGGANPTNTGWLNFGDSGNPENAASYVGLGKILDRNGMEMNIPTATGGYPVRYYLDVHSAARGTLYIISEDVNLRNASDVQRYVLIEGLYITQTGTDTPSFTLTSNTGSSEAGITIPGANVNRGRNLNVSVRNPSAGENFLYFDRLDIAENNRGDFTAGVFGESGSRGANTFFGQPFAVITMEAPADYRWVTPRTQENIGERIGGDDNFAGHNRFTYAYSTRYGDAYVTLQTSEAHPWVTSAEGWLADGRSSYWKWGRSNLAADVNKYLSVKLILNKNIPAALAERISLRGVGLTADNRADFSSVNVNYVVEWWQERSISTTATDYFIHSSNFDNRGSLGASARADINATTAILPNRVNNQRWNWRSFDAGTRAWNELGLDLMPGSEATRLRSGDQGSLIYSPGNDSHPDVIRNWTQVVRLDEKAVGSWGASLGNEVRFNMPEHGGAVIVAAQIAIPDPNFPIYDVERPGMTNPTITGENIWEGALYFTTRSPLFNDVYSGNDNVFWQEGDQHWWAEERRHLGRQLELCRFPRRACHPQLCTHHPCLNRLGRQSNPALY